MSYEEIVAYLLAHRENLQDELQKELFEDLVRAAIKYSNFRAEWYLYDPAKRQETDSYRTSAHNRFIDTLNIFLRYLSKSDPAVPDITELDRKAIGDIACLLTCQIAISQR